jgi:putative membrane protein
VSPKVKPLWKLFFAGMLGGAVDAAPSISGATVYYVVGIYKDLLSSISNVWGALYESFRTRSLFPLIYEPGLRYLLVLKCGVVLSFLFFARYILLCFEYPTARAVLFSMFFGFVFGSITLFIKKVDRWTKKRLLLFVVSFCVGIGVIQGASLFQEPLYSVPITVQLPEASNVQVTGNRLLHVPQSALYVLQNAKVVDSSREIVGESGRVDIVLLHNQPYVRFELILLGLLVAGAMLIPGVSGSYVLTIFGYYSLVLSAILEVTTNFFSAQFSTEPFFMLLNLGIGISTGIVFFSRRILWLFESHNASTHSCVAGGLFGTVWCLWPFQKLSYIVDPFHVSKGLHLISTGTYIPSLSLLSSSWYLFCIAACAYSSVFLLQYFSADEPTASKNLDKPTHLSCIQEI